MKQNYVGVNVWPLEGDMFGYPGRQRAHDTSDSAIMSTNAKRSFHYLHVAVAEVKEL